MMKYITRQGLCYTECMKKPNTKTRVSYKTTLLWLLVSTSFIMSGVALYVAVTGYSVQQWQAKNDSNALYNLMTEQARHEYCIDHAIRPCTSDTINKHAEAQ